MKFEEQLKQLENIVDKLDGEETSLEEGISLYEKGLSLTKDCLQALNSYKGKITEIKLEMDTLLEKPFDKD